ncbi:GNAT family N-acetyltransferase [uncultured Flavobacterium sp.]|uniref:GNAT family N-acetyltransferase n=1 Tax=uncultured Flavobacterium sp. TaxID=165435 RepID=UPI0025EEB1A0|nr:GNAT family N-acetyltransferase [uncultured Flavobacterium sp.]
MKYTIKKYQPSDFAQWNEFIARSKNGTFLFHRDFMEYHSDRFEDCSLIVFDGKNPVAVFPANRAGDALHSHQGLTYGGLILQGSIGVEKTELIFDSLINWLKAEGIARIYIKQVISIYHKEPANEAGYLLFKNGAQLYRSDMNLAIDYALPLQISKSKMKNFRKASATGFEIKASDDFGIFWDQVLVPRLSGRHGVAPVHTKAEIQLLHERFPGNILQYNIYHEEDILAGITLFHFGNVVKSQYGATTALGEKMRALDYLFIYLIHKYQGEVQFFDMGTVNEQQGKVYNKGLLKQKEELGCRVYPHDYYSLTL